MTILLFGATGSAGGSVLDVCLASDDVREVRVMTRRPLARTHPKLRVAVRADFNSYSGAEGFFADVDACLFCLGKSVQQVSGEAEYRIITRDFAIAAARMLQAGSPAGVFHYLSGRGAHLQSRFMWARVKAEAERDLLELCGAVCWRPAAIDGKPSTSEPWLYGTIRPLYRLFSPIRSLYVTGDDIGRAMLQARRERVRASVIENTEIRAMADRAKKGVGRGIS